MGPCSWASAYGSRDEALVERESAREGASRIRAWPRAFGVVIGGRHRRLGHDMAIKLVTPALVQNDVVRARFLAEARVLAATSDACAIALIARSGSNEPTTTACSIGR